MLLKCDRLEKSSITKTVFVVHSVFVFVAYVTACNVPGVIPWGVLPYLVMVGRFSGDDPRFWDFQSDWVPILYLNTIRLTHLFLQKKMVCLYQI